MKIVYNFILALGIVLASDSYTFELTYANLSNTTLEFRASYQAYQMDLKCDNYTNEMWHSYNYEYLRVTPEQRKAYKCSDQNFTLTLSSDMTQDEVQIIVLNASNYSQQLGKFDFLQPSQYTKRVLKENVAQVMSIYQSMNDIELSVTYPSTIYVEIFQCPNYQENLTVKFYNKSLQYRNLSSIYQKNIFYDVFSTTGQISYYRLKSINSYNTGAFMKYQKTAQFVDIDRMRLYASKTYVPVAEVRQNKIIVKIPCISANYSEKVEFHVSVVHAGYEYNDQRCAFGDKNLSSYYGQSYYTNFYTINQEYRYKDYQEEVFDFPIYYSGMYNIEIVAIIDYNSIKQTIPFEIVQVYQNQFDPSDSKLIHILAPVIISILALFGLIVGGCQYRKKMLELQQQQLLEQQQQQYLAQNNQPYLGVQ